ncbi:hypothetical protein B0H14DRAFT_3612676 [Mycena olivaceomarginata]|nr:hypothetical protein B0H14DRAFT_3612676 [Mycena olivaceomarginata]
MFCRSVPSLCQLYACLQCIAIGVLCVWYRTVFGGAASCPPPPARLLPASCLPPARRLRCVDNGVLRINEASRPSAAVHFCTPSAPPFVPPAPPFPPPAPPFPPPARRLLPTCISLPLLLNTYPVAPLWNPAFTFYLPLVSLSRLSLAAPASDTIVHAVPHRYNRPLSCRRRHHRCRRLPLASPCSQHFYFVACAAAAFLPVYIR